MRIPYKPKVNKFTIIVVENPQLKKFKKEYKTAINVLDHIIFMHTGPNYQNKKPGEWKYVDKITDEVIKSCNTKFALVVKIGCRFNLRVIFDNFDYDKYSLMGHILDGNANGMTDRYFYVHDQCYIVNVEDYDTTPTDTLRLVNRSKENFHDDYTPIWTKDGGKEIPLQSKVDETGFLISNLLRKGKHISPFQQTIRNDKRFLYVNNKKNCVDPRKYRKFIKRNQKVFAWSTETQYDIEEVSILDKEYFLGCANGLQALLYMNPDMKEINLFDINKNALTFTKRLLEEWNLDSYSSFCKSESHYTNFQYTSIVGDKEIPMVRMTPEYLDQYFFNVHEMNPYIIDVLSNIRKGNIKINYHQLDITKFRNIYKYISLPKSVVYFSNVSNYSITAHRDSMMTTDLKFKEILSSIDKTSIFIGSSAEFYFKFIDMKSYVMSVSDHLKYPWRKEEFKNYDIKQKRLQQISKYS